jgi:DNA-binding NarL/FixJ family response regulator
MEKPHQNKNWLAEQIASGLTSKQIGDSLNVSYKLIEIYLRQYEISFVPRNS